VTQRNRRNSKKQRKVPCVRAHVRVKYFYKNYCYYCYCYQEAYEKQVHPFVETGAPICGNRCTHLGKQVHLFRRKYHGGVHESNQRKDSHLKLLCDVLIPNWRKDYQFSIVNSQFSIINCQFSILNYQLSIVNWICGDGGSRTLVRTRKPYAFYTLIPDLIFVWRQDLDHQPAPYPQKLHSHSGAYESYFRFNLRHWISGFGTTSSEWRLVPLPGSGIKLVIYCASIKQREHTCCCQLIFRPTWLWRTQPSLRVLTYHFVSPSNPVIPRMSERTCQMARLWRQKYEVWRTWQNIFEKKRFWWQ